MASRQISENFMRLNKLSPNHPALIFFKKEDVDNLDEFTLKVHIEFEKASKRVVSTILQEHLREKYCQTELMGVHRSLEMQNDHFEELYEVKDVDKSVQAQVETAEKCEGHPKIEYQDLES